jgi:murein L,D-transpeptidase YcbB/YkuD
MNFRAVLAPTLLLSGLLAAWVVAAADAVIRQAMEDIQASVDGPRLQSPHLLDALYARSGHARVWMKGGMLTAHGRALVDILADAQDHGLDARDYHLPEISAAIAAGRMADGAGAALDLLLSDGALTYATHLLSGKVRPEQLYDSWKARPRAQDVVSPVWQALSADAPSLAGVYEKMAPQDPRYRQLKALLADLRDSIGPPLPTIPRLLLRLGDRGPAVSSVRQRISAWLGGGRADGGSDVYDIALEAAVKQFQLRHGLEPDGVVGPKTLKWLNRSYAQRMRQVRVNMERWRWMPAELGHRRIEVNIAGFRVEVMEADRKVLSMRAIVGKPYHKTPVFSDRMAYLVLNPSWNVPWSIAVNEILPKIRREPGYLSENNMRVLSGWGYDAEVVDRDGIDWATMTGERFRYRLQQMPGEDNALGRVKFMFPNEFDVYLHDTPSRSLFTSESRGFSHGCVRIEKPLELTYYLLRGEPQWTKERIDRVLSSGVETEVSIRHSIPVHIMYWTVWIDGSGLPHFRNDVYGRDGPLAAALIDD